MSATSAHRARAHLSLVPPVVSPGERTGSDRRAYRRLTVSELAWLEQVRLKYGPLVSLIDLSSGGAQIETTNHRLTPGGALVMQLSGPGTDLAVPARVLRCHVAGIGASTIYRSALEFRQPFEMPSHGDVDGVAYNPLHEHARLSLALRRAAESLPRAADGAPSETRGIAAALTAARALIESPSARRGGAAFAREAGRLFHVVSQHVESGAPHEAIVAATVDRLRRAIPARTIRMLDSAGLVTAQDPDAIYFDVPRVPDQPPVKLLVEFPRGCRLEDWHLEFLKVATQLIALSDEIELARATPAPEPAETPAAAPERTAEPQGWNRIVVRYRDGRMLKGFANTFQPAVGQLHVSPVPDAPAVARITVPFAQLKAVFFVHDLDGRIAGDKPASGAPVAGRAITVTFLDGEVLAGTTLNYNAEGPGFFVLPADDSTNNVRVFVVTPAVRHVQFT